MQHRIGDAHRSRLLCLLAFVFAFLLAGFAEPQDPRITIEAALTARPPNNDNESTIALVLIGALLVLSAGAFALSGTRRSRCPQTNAAHVPCFDAGSGGGDLSGGAGASSSW